MQTYSLLRALSGFTSTCPQTDVEEHPVSLGVTCSQHAESASRCHIYRSGLLLKWVASRFWIDTGTQLQRSNPGPLRAKQWLCHYVMAPAHLDIILFKLNDLYSLSSLSSLSPSLRIYCTVLLPKFLHVTSLRFLLPSGNQSNISLSNLYSVILCTCLYKLSC